MKKLILFICCIILLTVSCKKEDSTTCPSGLAEGRIIGLDASLCACCGGYWIEIGTDTLRSFTLPENIKTEDWTFTSEGFDISVCLSYKKSTDCQIMEELIDIEELILQE